MVFDVDVHYPHGKKGSAGSVCCGVYEKFNLGKLTEWSPSSVTPWHRQCGVCLISSFVFSPQGVDLAYLHTGISGVGYF